MKTTFLKYNSCGVIVFPGDTLLYFKETRIVTVAILSAYNTWIRKNNIRGYADEYVPIMYESGKIDGIFPGSLKVPGNNSVKITGYFSERKLFLYNEN